MLTIWNIWNQTFKITLLIEILRSNCIYNCFLALGAHLEFGPNGIKEFDPTSPKLLDRYKRQLDEEELLNLSPEELCKDRVSEEYFRLTTEGDCRDVVR